jgi:adenine-specific DNA-methyltransferase
MTADGAMFVSIDKAERTVVEHMLDEVFGPDNRIEELIWSMNTNNSQAPNYSTNHEYVEVYAKNRRAAEQDPSMFREPKPGYEEVMELVNRLNPEYPSIAVIEGELRKLYEQHKIEFREEIEAQGLEWEDEKNNDPWKGLYNYSHAEYRDPSGKLVSESEARAKGGRIWVWQEDNTSMPATKQAASTRDPNHKNYRFYQPLHPGTGQPCPHPKSGWKFAYDDDEDSPDRRSFVSLDRDGRIAWGPDEKKVPRLKRMLHEVETNIGKSVFADYSDGEKQTSAMFGRSGVFLAPKHADFVSRFLLHAAKSDSTILDSFGGSGSTAHAVIKLNRSDRGKRRYVLTEVAEYFDTVLKPRVLKAVYSPDWRSGKPISRKGISHCVKVLRLESYEDTLNNLELKRSDAQQSLLDQHAELREDYMLRYMLDVESRGSASLLNIERFDDPFDYKLNISTGTAGETEPRTVDLVETFNWLLGLRVKTMDEVRGVRVVTGLNPAGERVLILWRKVRETDNDALDAWFRKQGYNTKDQEFDVIYVNGDNNLENLRQGEQTWKVRLIEQEFQRLMFDEEGI